MIWNFMRDVLGRTGLWGFMVGMLLGVAFMLLVVGTALLLKDLSTPANTYREPTGTIQAAAR